MGWEWRKRMLWAIALVLALSTTAFGQQVLRGSIAGTVKDDTGATLPGVTVTVTSPALQVPQILRVSDERGAYQIPDLPAGTYRVTYELTGFATLVREGIILTTGFAARVDVDMKVAALAETITVSGETPLVDVTSTRGGTTVSQELLAAIPTNRNAQDLTVMVGGLIVLGPPMTGEIVSGRGGFRGIKTYGGGGTQTRGGGGGSQITEGVRMNENDVPDYSAFEEIDVKTFGNTADIDSPGLAAQYIAKSGGNQFHGAYQQVYQHHRFGSTNIDDTLRAQGLTTGNQIRYFSDSSADLGGRIVRDKIWFYSAVRAYRNKTTSAGYASGRGPDGVYGTLDDIAALPKASTLATTWKVSYQATPKHKFVSFGQYSWTHAESTGDRFTPQESRQMNDNYPRAIKPIEWQGTLSNRLIASLMWGYGGYWSDRTPLRADWPDGEPSRFDRNTGITTGPSGVTTFNRNARIQFSGRANYLPAGSFLGSHDLQTGYLVFLGGSNIEGPSPNRPTTTAGLYRLTYDTIGGVPYQPVEITVNNAPFAGGSKEYVYAWYGMDTWRLTNRLTMNVGLRLDRQAHFVPPQVKVQGTYGTAGTFPRVDAGTWTALAPRVGVAFDLSGNGKTVVKGTFGRFNHDLDIQGPGPAYNQNTSVSYTYRWRDLNGDRNYQPGEVNFDLNGADFLSVAGATNNRVNPDLKLPHTYEATASLERELGNGMSVRTLFIYKKIVDNFDFGNFLRPFNVYDQVFTRRDPGPDGVLGGADDGELFTLYDYNPAYRGAAFVQNMFINTTPDLQDSFRNVELTLTKRPTGRWFANTSILVTKNHRSLIKVIQSPNDQINRLDETWEWSYRLAGGYHLPFGINVSTLYSAYSGLPRQRTNVFRAADPAGGRAFPSSSTITLRMEPYGTKRLPVRNILNLRGDKDFTLGGGQQFTASVDVFNALNTNAAWGEQQVPTISDVSGPTYGNVIRIVYPRVLRFNVGYKF